MPVKELIAATAILVLCFGLLYMAHNEPEGTGEDLAPDGFATQIDEQVTPPPDRAPTPPVFGSDPSGVSFGEIGLDDEPADVSPIEGFEDDPVIPFGDEPGDILVADAGFDDEPIADPIFVEPDAPEPALPGPGASGSAKTHVIARGETLMDISYAHYGTHQRWREIAEANDVDPMSMQVGQEIIIPALDDVVPAAAHGSSAGDTYVVNKGDSYYTIARDRLGDASRYKEIINLNSIEAYDLMPGMVIKLPKGPRVAAAGTAQPAVTRSSPNLPAGARWHVVERGEVLGTISQRYYNTARRWRDIAEANGINDPADLRVGQKLVIPDAPAGAPAPAVNRAAGGGTRSGPGQWHTVAGGDVLGTISQQYYGTATRWRDIQEANPGVNPAQLVVGNRLWIPGASAAAAPRSNPVVPVRVLPSPEPSPVRGNDLTWPELNDGPSPQPLIRQPAPAPDPVPAPSVSTDNPFDRL